MTEQNSNVPASTPIMVNKSAAPDTWEALLRYVLMAFAAIASALGYTKAAGEFSALLVAVGPVSMAVTAGWGMWKANQSARQKIVMEPYAPNSVATVRK